MDYCAFAQVTKNGELIGLGIDKRSTEDMSLCQIGKALAHKFECQTKIFTLDLELYGTYHPLATGWQFIETEVL